MEGPPPHNNKVHPQVAARNSGLSSQSSLFQFGAASQGDTAGLSPSPRPSTSDASPQPQLHYMTSQDNMTLPTTTFPEDVAAGSFASGCADTVTTVSDSGAAYRSPQRRYIVQDEEAEEVHQENAAPVSSGCKTRFDHSLAMMLAFWTQLAEEGEALLHKNQPSKETLRKDVENILNNSEVETKESLRREIQFILNHFRQRRCRNYCHSKSWTDYARDVMKQRGKTFHTRNPPRCKCGLLKDYHTDEARNEPVAKWKMATNTELLYPSSFGNMDIPGHYNYLETPEGTRKYIRYDDIRTKPSALWELLTRHWGLALPKLVISVTGGSVAELHANPRLHQVFRDGLLKAAVTTKAWIITEGVHIGAAREIGNIFQEDLRRSQWSEVEDHATIPLIAVLPWGILADRKHLSGIYVGSEEAVYRYTSVEKHSQDTRVPNAIDPYHVVYLLPDDGTSGYYNSEPRSRINLEKFIRSRAMRGPKDDVKTPMVVLVLGGDKFTLAKLADVTSEDHAMSAVIVNGSGPIANMLADMYKMLEFKTPRSGTKENGWSDEEEAVLIDLLMKYEKQGVLAAGQEQEHVRTLMKARHLMEVFGTTDGDTGDLDKAILQATFGGISRISVQLVLALAMDRVDIARDSIFTESRKNELKAESDMLQEVLLEALKEGKTQFVEVLLDQDYGGQLEFENFLTIRRLHTLHSTNLDPTTILGKVLRSLCRRDTNGSYLLRDHQLVPQVGRIVHLLMGSMYRLLYQAERFHSVTDDHVALTGSTWATHRREEAVWHLFLWAVLANHRQIAELFLFESSCKIGAALVAFRLFTQMSKVAEKLAETELARELLQNADYYQGLATSTLENLYEVKREEAYASLVSVMPFNWGKYVTPLALADNSEAMRFMGHACCQTLLNLLWMQYMDLDTEKWKLFPLFALFPVNIPMIVFDKKNLDYGVTMMENVAVKPAPRGGTVRNRNTSETRYDDKAGSIANLKSGGGGGGGGAGASGDAAGGSGGGYEAEQEEQESLASRVWFKIHNYYTAPVNKFMFYVVSWVIFLGLFTHFLVTELRPVQSASQVTVYVWLVMAWVACITLDEFKQCFWRASTGPLWNIRWEELEPHWRDTWYLGERFLFVLRLYKVSDWLSDRWNKVDALMITCYWASVICRFLVASLDFGVVRIMYSITIIIFYFRLLRIGYIIKAIGPRVITIKAMLQDLGQFLSILMVFIISFGVAFQAILFPNQSPSWETLVDILWRPYWQMFGELFLDDVQQGMGRPLPDGRASLCTYNRTVAEAMPDTHPFCYHWMAPILLGIFMLITNILLLNLLIAIFSHSFDKIESDAHTIWRFHMYDLVHEYYHQPWLPPPLNVLCHLADFIIWLSKWPRKCCYHLSRKRHMKYLADSGGDGQGKGSSLKSKKEAELDMEDDVCYCWYYDSRSKTDDDTDHFRQPVYARDEDLEEKAYKRYLRSQNRSADHKTHAMLESHDQRLQQIFHDLQDIKRLPREANLQLSSTNVDLQQMRAYNLHRSDGPNTRDMSALSARVDHVDRKMDKMAKTLDAVQESITQVLETVKTRKLRKPQSSMSSISEA